MPDISATIAALQALNEADKRWVTPTANDVEITEKLGELDIRIRKMTGTITATVELDGAAGTQKVAYVTRMHSGGWAPGEGLSKNAETTRLMGDAAKGEKSARGKLDQLRVADEDLLVTKVERILDTQGWGKAKKKGFFGR